jgi:phosphohistidine phosphatase
MIERLWLLRHGDAEPHGRVDDALRELTPVGREEAAAAGAALRQLGAPTRILTSPRLRAMQTAQIACGEFAATPEIEKSLTGGFRSTDALELLARSPGDDLLLVGHMPDLALVIGDLAGAQVALRTGGLALLRGSGSAWELACLLRPRETRAVSAS